MTERDPSSAPAISLGLPRDQAIASLLPHRTERTVIVATYQAAFDLMRLDPSPLNYLSIGAMGLASSHALGLALARPDVPIWVFDGDGSLLMNLGSLATMAGIAPPRLIHFVFHNATYEANGAHPLPGTGTLDFAGFAQAAGYATSQRVEDQQGLVGLVPRLEKQPGPHFVELRVVPGDPSPMDYGHIHSQAVRDAFRTAFQALPQEP